MRAFFISLIALSAVSLSLFGQSIKGVVIDRTKGEKIPYVNVELLDANKIVKCGTASDLDGGFRFVNVAKGIYSIKVSSRGYADTTIANVLINGDTLLKLDIRKYCKYDASLNDKTCPVCGKSDKVIPIQYGLLISTEKKKKKKDAGEYGDFYPAGYEITDCDPHWYCKRDQTKF